MRRYLSTSKQSICFAVLLASVLASFSFAQNQPAPNAAASQTQQLFLRSIVRVQLAAQREWLDIVKNEYISALKKAGVTELHVWKTATAGENGEYMLDRPIKNLAELDDPDPVVKALGQAGDRALFAKLDRITASVHTFVITSRPDLTIDLVSGYAPKLANFFTASVAPGRTADYEKNAKEFTQAIVGKTNAKGPLGFRVVAGGDTNEYQSLVLFDSFADMNQFGAAFRKAAEGAKLAPQQAGVVMHQERTIFQYIPELSFRPPAQKPAR